MNDVKISGNIGHTAELRYTNTTGTPVCNFSLASHEYFKDSQGEKRKRTEWHRVVIFGQMAANLADKLTKGRHVTISGRLATHTWPDAQGVKHYQTQIRAYECELGALPQPKVEQPAATAEQVAEVIENLEK